MSSLASASYLGLLAGLACLHAGARPSAQTSWTCEADIVFEGSTSLDHRAFGLDTSGNWNGDAYPGGRPLYDILAGGYQTDFAFGSAELFISRAQDSGFPLSPTCPFTGGRVRIVGEQQNDLFGYTAAFLGDIDADGRDDFAVSMVRGPSSGSTWTEKGAVYVFLSGDSGTGIPSAAPAGAVNASASNASLIIRGVINGCRFGHALAGIGDWEGDGDGVPDFLVGAPGDDVYPSTLRGRAYMISGAQVLAKSLLGAPVDVTDVLVSDVLMPGILPGIVLGGPGDRMGYSVAHIGEAGDTAHGSDFAVGAPQFDDPNGGYLGSADNSSNPGTGYVKVFLGQSPAPITLSGTQAKQRFGFSLAGKANVDGDAAGLDDVIVGSPFWELHGSTYSAGKVYVYRGGTLALLGELTGVASAPPSEDRLGYDVSGLADFNGDGREEFGVGSYGFLSTAQGPFNPASTSPCWPCPKYDTLAGQALAVGGGISGRCQVISYNGSGLTSLAAYIGDSRDSAGSFISLLPAVGPGQDPAVAVGSFRWGDTNAGLIEVGRIQLFLWP